MLAIDRHTVNRQCLMAVDLASSSLWEILLGFSMYCGLRALDGDGSGIDNCSHSSVYQLYRLWKWRRQWWFASLWRLRPGGPTSEVVQVLR